MGETWNKNQCDSRAEKVLNEIMKVAIAEGSWRWVWDAVPATVVKSSNLVGWK